MYPCPHSVLAVINRIIQNDAKVQEHLSFLGFIPTIIKVLTNQALLLLSTIIYEPGCTHRLSVLVLDSSAPTNVQPRTRLNFDLAPTRPLLAGSTTRPLLTAAGWRLETTRV